MRRIVPLLVPLILPLGGCQHWQSVLNAQGPAASSLARMFWIFVAVLAAVWVLTMIALLLSLRRRRPADADPLTTNPATERRMTITISVAIGLTLMTVISLTGLSYAAQKALFAHKD